MLTRREVQEYRGRPLDSTGDNQGDFLENTQYLTETQRMSTYDRKEGKIVPSRGNKAGV